jgi:hypothetical protein
MSKALITLDTDEVWDIWYGMVQSREHLRDQFGPDSNWAARIQGLVDKYGDLYDAMREEDMA